MTCWPEVSAVHYVLRARQASPPWNARRARGHRVELVLHPGGVRPGGGGGAIAGNAGPGTLSRSAAQLRGQRRFFGASSTTVRPCASTDGLWPRIWLK
jgi:hypothetical protein